MSISLAKTLGAFIRWLLKGCKTILKDEVNGNLEPRWLKSHDTENYIIGLVSGVVIFLVIAAIYVF
ncbi:MAG: hypothetical protein IKI09_01430 [Bacteroidales bacterium]|nr:hypothetical protein [Bacteroidales bacterium]